MNATTVGIVEIIAMNGLIATLSAYAQRNKLQKPKKPVTPCFKRDYKLQEIGRHDWTRTNDPYHVKAGNRMFMDIYGFYFSSVAIKIRP
jgi:hypothetical protein